MPVILLFQFESTFQAAPVGMAEKKEAAMAGLVSSSYCATGDRVAPRDLAPAFGGTEQWP